MRKASAMAVVVGLLLSSSGGAHAQQKAEAKKPAAAPAAAAGAKKPAVDVAPAIKKIESGDENQIREGLDEVRIAGPGGGSAGPAIANVLTKGASLAITMSAIETLADIEAESGSAALADYVTHRNVKVRRAATKALARTKGAAAGAALRKALSDSDPVVRGTAASSIGALKAKDAVPDLFVALDHKVNEAAASIGQLCSPEQCDQLASKLGKLPFDVVSQALDQILFRPATDMPDDAKIKVIGKIRELGTIEANKFLRDVQKRWPANGSKRVRQSIDQAVIATSGGTQ